MNELIVDKKPLSFMDLHSKQETFIEEIIEKEKGYCDIVYWTNCEKKRYWSKFGKIKYRLYGTRITLRNVPRGAVQHVNPEDVICGGLNGF